MAAGNTVLLADEVVSSGGGASVLDSGASCCVSAELSDFANIDWHAKIPLRGLSAQSVGYMGVLNPNALGLREAVYFPALPVRRLLSLSKLCGIGWAVTFSEKGATGKNAQTGQSFEVGMVRGLYEGDVGDFRSGTAAENHPEHALLAEAENSSTARTPLPAPPRENEFWHGNFVFLNPDPPFYLSEDAAAAEQCWLTRPSTDHDRHQRNMHLSHPLIRHTSTHCCERQAGKSGTGKSRGPDYKPAEVRALLPLQKLQCDYYGTFAATSLAKNTILFAAICEISGFCWTALLRAKSDAAGELRRFVEKMNRPNRSPLIDSIRSDNEPVLLGREFQKMVRETLGLDHTSGPPYHPTSNSTIERFFRTLGDALRAALVGVDPRTWDYASEHFGWLFNRRPRTGDGEFQRIQPVALMRALVSLRAGKLGRLDDRWRWRDAEKFKNHTDDFLARH